MRRAALAAPPLLAAAVISACGASSTRDLTVRTFDAGAEASVDAAPEASIDAAADADPTLGGPCVDDAQCDDQVPCTFDVCDPTARRCRNVPDDTRCDDGVYCNGREVCAPGRGCQAGAVVTCEDGDSCTIDRCIEATKSCAHAPRDQDGDGDPDDHCVPKKDCDDLDPTVSSTHTEVCANHKDDNCDGRIDETPCASAAGDTCAVAVAIAGPGTYALSSVGANEDYASSCSVTTASAAKDIVAAITVPAGAPKDLEVWATTPGTEVALALDASCGVPASELACSSASGASSVRARARSVAPGTYFAIVTTQAESDVELAVTLLDPTAKPTNEDCATAVPITPGATQTIALVDPKKDLPSACAAQTGELTYTFTLAQASDVRVFASTVAGSGQPVIGLRAAQTGELTYTFTLAQASDVRVFASTVAGSGQPVVGLRDAQCTGASDELRCRSGSQLPLFARDLPAGAYVLTVAGTASIDVSVDVEVAPATAPLADETCAAPPVLTANAATNVDLSAQDDAIHDGCLPGGPTAAFDLPLAVDSDVLLVGRFPQIEQGAVSLDAPACTEATRLACVTGRTPVRVTKRGLTAGDYRVVVSDMSGQSDSITPLVRAAVPPTAISGGDACADVVDIPKTGGFFTGDTTNAAADFDNPCNAPSATPGGAPDQVLRLTLAQPQRVVFSMDGSSFTTVLDVRSGPSCPGTTITNGCYVGFEAQRSFLDVELDAGTYYVIVDGYSGAKGPWDLDVRVLPP